ncbi:LysR family transcriptional regulator [Hahella sp. CCB-MM4]|uniref:LysR substrate-binding domain-containing protein n=1 Tax=Hahella sp. (strain CCB-MM4) TaxID=1926491 RepID=UPI000B9B825E|nr:LysR substrate-binding domain-containing protein [Hahella sp. CCB-MM4]OZG71881.1 LysR family transcriptional regulator [Hahella sp. CCB-MM4]
MDIDLLRTYLAIVDTGSFTRAARQTFRTQSAVSMQMKRLEADVERALFRREGRSLELTDDGKRLVHHARRILAVHDEAMASMRPDAGTFRIRLGCPDDYARSILPRMIMVMRELYPNISLNVQCASSNKLRQLMDEGEIDLAVLTRAPGSDEGYLLLEDQGVWAAARGRRLQEGEVLPLAIYEPDCKFHSAALDGLDKLQRPYELLMTSSNASALLAMVKEGGAITAVATSTLSEDMAVLGAEHHLPPLPRVEIAVMIAGQPHPMMTPAFVKDLIARYREVLDDRELHQAVPETHAAG